MAGEMALLIPLVAVFIPIVAIWANHQQKMAMIKADSGTKLAPEVQAELDRLRDEVATLRETTTRFDMSFDAALTRLEDRMDSADIGVDPVEVRRTAVGQGATSETMSVGRGR